jgi:opacity protein-like surface antigen
MRLASGLANKSRGTKMKLRALLLGSALALAAPSAFADSNPGWYLGLGVGYDHLEPISVVTAAPLDEHADLGQSDNVIVVGSVGYKWSSNLRLEFEAGYDSHGQKATNPSFGGTFSGSSSVQSDLVNFVYDFPLSDLWTLSLGGGVGAGNVRMSVENSMFPGVKVIHGQHTEFMWQGITGLAFELAPDSDIFLD